MRTDRLMFSALALAAALVAVPGASAQAPPPAPASSAPVTVTKGGKMSLNGVTVERGERVDGDVVAPFGDVRVAGEVTGDVIVGKGNLVLSPGAVIHGDAVVNGGGTLQNRGGRVLGEMRVNSDDDRDDAAAAVDAQESDAHSYAAGNVRIPRHGWWGSMQDGFEGLVSTLTFALILCGLGAAVVFYALPQLDRVTHVVRTEPGRSAGLGVAAAVLVIPAFVIAMFLLVITIIGIPVAVLFAPLFWSAVVGAWLYGLIAVAQVIGERTAEQSQSFSSIRRNAYTYVFTGVGLLLAPLVVGNLLKLTGFLGWLGMMVNGLAWTVLFAAGLVGFGAVAFTRGGTRPGWPWNVRPRAYDPIFDDEPFVPRSPKHEVPA